MLQKAVDLMSPGPKSAFGLDHSTVFYFSFLRLLHEPKFETLSFCFSMLRIFPTNSRMLHLLSRVLCFLFVCTMANLDPFH